MKEHALLIIVAVISHALSGHYTSLLENDCEDMAEVLQQFKATAHKAGVSIADAMQARTCTSAYDSEFKRSVKSIAFEFGGQDCTISYAHKPHSTVLIDEADELIAFKQQVEACNSQLKQTKESSTSSKILARAGPAEKDSSDWALLMRAFTKFSLNRLIHSHVLYKQNVVKYTHMEDDGEHLRVILALNRTECELQVYKHPAHEGDHARVCHDKGPAREQRSHYIRSRADRRFVLPNCAILFATEEGRRHIAAFMRE